MGSATATKGRSTGARARAGGGAGPAGYLPGTIAVGLCRDNEYTWSRPVLARHMIFADIYSGDGTFIFDCHSIWFGWTDRSTACEATPACPGKLECRCDNAGEGRKRFNCSGWRICICK